MAGTLHFSFHDQWEELKHGRPGHRFQDRYERIRRKDRRSSALVRIALIIVAILAIAIGVVLSVIPGPAFPFFILAGALLAAESRLIARFMDWCEVRVRKVLAWAKRNWRRTPLAGRVLVGFLMVGVTATAAYAGFRIFSH